MKSEIRWRLVMPMEEQLRETLMKRLSVDVLERLLRAHQDTVELCQ